MKFLTEMWHPNSACDPFVRWGSGFDVLQSMPTAMFVFPFWLADHFYPLHPLRDPDFFRTQHAPGEDEYGFEKASERWSPVQSVTSIVSILRSHWYLSVLTALFQLISVISMLSSDPPDTSSPANVDAAKQVREDIPGSGSFILDSLFCLTSLSPAYRKKVRRLSRRSAEEVFDWFALAYSSCLFRAHLHLFLLLIKH